MTTEEPDLDTSVFLHDDACWVYDPDALHPDSGVEGVIALIYRSGTLFYLDGATRKWLSVEASTTCTKPTRIK